ncbi:MAG: hypothetical protein KDA80_19285, partial [Planctomycetaceae bacterium]|nr:hypothetical protein [Planctomycetaceae bacterium]
MEHSRTLSAVLKRIIWRPRVAEAKRVDDFVILSLDRLEERCVLNAASATLIGDVLMIDGATAPDPVDDLISISIRDPDTTIEQIVVDLGPTGPQAFNSVDVREIQVRLFDGDDILQFQVPTAGAQPFRMEIDGGNGQDVVRLIDNGLDAGGSPLGRADTITVNAETIEFGNANYGLGSGDLQLIGTVSLHQNVAVDLNGDLEIQGDIVGNSRSLFLDTSGDLSVDGQIGSVLEPLRGVALSAEEISLNGADVQERFSLDSALNTLAGDYSAGTIAIDGDLKVDGDVTLDATSDRLVLSSVPIHGNMGDSLTLFAHEEIILGPTFGLDSLTADSHYGEIVLTGNIETTGSQRFLDAVSLGDDVTLSGQGITFQDTVTGAGNSLFVQDSRATHFAGDIHVAVLETDPLGSTVFGDLGATTPLQVGGTKIEIRDALTLQQSVAVVMGDVASFSVIDDFGINAALSVEAGLVTRLSGDVSLGTLDVTGATAVFANQIRTTGEQTFEEMSVFAETTFQGSDKDGDEIAVHVGGPLGGGGNDITFQGGVILLGTASHIGALTASHPGSLALVNESSISATSLLVNGRTRLGGDVTTVGRQSYLEAVVITSDVLLSTSDLTFSGTVDDDGVPSTPSRLTISSTGVASLAGPVGGTAPLLSLTFVSAGGTTKLLSDVTTIGSQIYGNDLLLCADVTLQSIHFDLSFLAKIDSDTSQAYMLETIAQGRVFFAGDIGSRDGGALGGLTVVATTSLSTGTMNLQGPLAVSARDVIFVASVLTTDGGAVSITNSGSLTVASGADFDLDGPFTQTGNGSVHLAGDITTTGDEITFEGPVSLAERGFISLNTTGDGTPGSAIVFQSTLDSSSHGAEALTLNAGTGAISFQAEVGASAPLGDVTILQAGDVTLSKEFTAQSLTQLTGTGTTTINGATTMLSSRGLDISTGNVVQNGLVDTWRAGTGGGIRFQATEDLLLNGPMRSRAGDVTLIANRDVEVTELGTIQTVSGGITVVANADHNAGEIRGRITQDAASLLVTDSGTILMDARGTITLGQLISLSD